MTVGVNVKCARGMNSTIIALSFAKFSVTLDKHTLHFILFTFMLQLVKWIKITFLFTHFSFYKRFSLCNSLRLHTKHQQIWLYVINALVNVIEITVDYSIKLFHISAVTNCQIRRTAGLFRETFLKGIHTKIVGYAREWEIFPCKSEVLLIRFRVV